MPRGKHQFPFIFNLPESALPCSFESRTGYIRYYVKATVDRPYASPPQGLKYFTLIGPHIDCMDEQYLVNIIYKDSQLLILSYCNVSNHCYAIAETNDRK